MERQYEQRITTQQKEVLLQFMEQHMEFAKSKLLGVEGRKQKNALWSVLTEQLNACDGPKKTVEKWQRVWADLKTKTKRKAADIKAARIKTGGGPASAQVLSRFEEQLVTFLSEEAVHGLEGPDGVPLESEERHGATVSRTPSPPPLSDDAADFSSVPPTSPDYVSEDSVTAAPVAGTSRGTKRKRLRQPSSETSLNRFITLNETLNSKMDAIIGILQETLEERRQTNYLLGQLVEIMRQE